MAAETLQALIGRNARRIRTDARFTLDRVAAEVTALGHPWTHSRVAAFERGTVAATLPMLLIVASALNRLVEAPVTLADLVASTDPVQITEAVAVEASLVAAALSGEPVDIGPADPFANIDDAEPMRTVLSGTGRAERDLAASLGIDARTLADASRDTWGRSYSDERDRRAGAGASAQAKGRVSRELRVELQRTLDEYANINDEA